MRLIFFLGCFLLISADTRTSPGSVADSNKAQKKMRKLFKKIDANRDKSLSRDELKDYFKAMDGSGDEGTKDKKISKEEFVEFNQDKKNKENRFKSELVYGEFDRDNNGNLNNADAGKFIEDFDKNGDGKVDSSEFIEEVEKETDPLDEAIEEIFVVDDMNYNGFWDRIDQHALWNQYDSNRDGILSPTEFANYWNPHYCTSLGPASYWFTIFDTNSDGKIDEFIDKENVVKAFDINGDNNVTEKEMKIIFKKLIKELPKKWDCPSDTQTTSSTPPVSL